MKVALQALILARTISRDASGSFTIVTLDEVEVAPGNDDAPKAVANDWFIYLALTGVTKDKSLTMRFIDLSEDTQAAAGLIAVDTNDDPLQAVRLSRRLPPIPLRIGPHACEMWDGEQLLGSYRFRVVERTRDLQTTSVPPEILAD